MTAVGTSLLKMTHRTLYLYLSNFLSALSIRTSFYLITYNLHSTTTQGHSLKVKAGLQTLHIMINTLAET